MGQLCSIKSGKSDTKDAVEDGAYAFFDRSRTIKRSSRYLFDCEALIIPGEGTEFLPKYFTGKFDLHQRAYALHDFSDRIDVAFLFYFLHHLCDYFPRVAVGATVKSLRLRHFEQLPVSLTSLPEQHRIVGILDEAFEGIATAKANAEKNLENARALFESHLQSVFTQRGVGWAQESLESLVASGDVQLARGKVISRRDLAATPGEFPVYSSAKENDGRFGAYGLFMFDEELITWSVDGGGRLFHRPRHKFSVTNVGGILRIHRLDKLSYEYLFRVLSYLHSQVRFDWVRKAHPSVILKLYDDIPVPPLDTQSRVAESLREIECEVKYLESIYRQKLGALDMLNKSLLHQAFTGRLATQAA